MPLLRDGHGAGRFQVRKEATCPTLTCPLGQLQEHWLFPYLPREQDAKLMASAGVTAVTGASSVFWTRVIE